MSSDTEAAYLLEQWVGLDAILSGAARRSSRELLTARTSRYLNERADSAVPSSHVSAWISVDERMPVGDVLLCTTSRVCIIGDWYIDGWRTHRSAWEGQKLVHAYRREDITHWMPLPEPPQRAAASPISTASAPANSETDDNNGPETVAYLHDRGSDNKLSFSAEPIDGRTSYEIRELVFKDASSIAVLREALVRLLKANESRLWVTNEVAEAMEAARSALAGIPLNASGDPTERSG